MPFCLSLSDIVKTSNYEIKTDCSLISFTQSIHVIIYFVIISLFNYDHFIQNKMIVSRNTQSNFSLLHTQTHTHYSSTYSQTFLHYVIMYSHTRTFGLHINIPLHSFSTCVLFDRQTCFSLTSVKSNSIKPCHMATATEGSCNACRYQAYSARCAVG